MRNIKGILASILASIITVVVCMSTIFVSKANNESANSNLDERIEFEINSTAIDNQEVPISHEAVYDSQYFYEKSTIYNNDLAKLSLQMALAASCTAQTFCKYGEVLPMTSTEKNIDFTESRNGYLAKAYKDMGFSKDIYYKYDTSLNDTSDSVAHGIASKKIKVGDSEYTLVNVAVRSSTYGGEWASNYNMINEEGVLGVYSAGRKVYEHIEQYIKDNKLGKNTKIWICGLSRGAAAANVATAFVDRACRDKKINVDRNNVYGYMIATTNCVMDPDETEVKSSLYDNIFNIIYEADIIAKTAPESYGFKKYGKIYTIPSITISGKDMKRYEQGKTLKDKNITKEEIELAKEISQEYNKIRYDNYEEQYKNQEGKFYSGFTVPKGLLDAVDIGFYILGEDANEYKDIWQSVVTDIMPFAIARTKKYNNVTGEWVRYVNIKEYLVDKYGQEVFNKAIEEGIYSEKVYNEKISKIEEKYKKGKITEEEKNKKILVIDTYYGIRVAAINYNIDSEFIKKVGSRIMKNIGSLLECTYPISDCTSCVDNHSGEFYLAWLRIYDVENNCIR